MKPVYMLLFLLGLAFTSQAQETKDIKNVIDSKNYVFTAQSATPIGGRYRQLTSDYDLRIVGDSVVAFLPYFGRAFSAPMDPSRGGIQFTSTDFGYEQTDRRKGGWIISIKPKDVQDVRELTLSVTESGRATLQVLSNSRQSISFNGYVAARK
ncbi:MAG TPA: DUF4251 domain-containing protein [Chitinophagaceae bacterium]|nr:DUF4251 domain-containing protein [Chitinophagaceae bacterium]